MQVKVTRVSRKDTKADGTKLIGKYDKPYWKISIQVEGSEEWYGGFANNMNDPMYQIQEGGTYSIAVTESPKADGNGTWKNFKLLTPEEKELEELRALKASMEKGPQTGTALAPVPMPAQVVEPVVDLDSF